MGGIAIHLFLWGSNKVFLEKKASVEILTRVVLPDPLSFQPRRWRPRIDRKRLLLITVEIFLFGELTRWSGNIKFRTFLTAVNYLVPIRKRFYFTDSLLRWRMQSSEYLVYACGYIRQRVSFQSKLFRFWMDPA